MRLVFAHDHIFYKYKGEHYSTGGLSKEMLERYTKVFDEVIVLSRQKTITEFNDKLTIATTKNVTFIEIPNFKSVKNIHQIIKAKKTIKDEIQKADSLIARLPSSIGSIAVSEAKNSGKPYLIEVVACPWDALWNHSLKGRFMAPFSYLSTKKHVRAAEDVVYVTNNFLQKRYPTNGNSVNCSNVALKDFDGLVIKERLEQIQNTNLEGRKIIIGTTAAIDVRYKGQQYIIEALGKLKKKGNLNFEYQLVGNGNEKFLTSVAIKNDVLEHVKFLGVLPHNDVFNWLKTIDIYAQPSRQEGLPRALIEAMSMGIPSFGANTAGIPELLPREFIFSNTKRNIKEIIDILTKMNNENMAIQAERNFEEAQKYNKDLIENRREEFFIAFKGS
ncbi:glycosyltransferase [Alkalihalobacillus sp. NPDC078783]